MTLKIVQRITRTFDSFGNVTMEKEVSVPALICDHCQREIDSEGWGSCCWRVLYSSGKAMQPLDGIMYHVHKGACQNAFTAGEVVERGFMYRHVEIAQMLGGLVESIHMLMQAIEHANPRLYQRDLNTEYGQECVDFHEKEEARNKAQVKRWKEQEEE